MTSILMTLSAWLLFAMIFRNNPPIFQVSRQKVGHFDSCTVALGWGALRKSLCFALALGSAVPFASLRFFAHPVY